MCARMSERFTVIVDIESLPDGAMTLAVRPADPAQSLHVQRPARLTLTIWSEGDDLIRLSVQHRRSRTVAYVQGNRALRELCENARLELHAAAEPIR
jgi:hypothetical protein